MRAVHLLTLVVATTALRFRPLKPLNTGFTEVSKTEYESSSLASGSAAEFMEQADKTTNTEGYHYHYNRKQKRMITEAKTVDQLMYGGSLFKPPPGHDMHFDFAQFGAFAEAHTASVRRQVADMSQTTVTNSSAGLVTSDFFMGCIEINLCANPPVANPTAGAGNSCVMIGLDGTVTLETKEGKQTLKIGVSLSAGVSFQMSLAALTVFITGGAEWEFEITGQKNDFYTSSYEAMLGAIRFWISSMSSSKLSLSNNFVQAATNARKSIAKANAQASALGKPQKDELTGMVKMHYKFLSEASRLVGAQTKLIETQNAIKSAAISTYFGATGTKVTEAMCKCDPKGKDVEQVLMCITLTSAPLLPSKQQTTTWIGGYGSNDNFQNGFPALFPEIYPLKEEDVAVIKDVLKKFETFGKAIKPTDWGNPTKLEREAEGKKFTQYAQQPALIDATENDPCKTLRSFLQYLAAPSTELAKTKFSPPNSNGVTFHFTKVSVTGTIGATFGAGSVGYCTADENVFQFQVAVTKEYNPVTGEWDGGLFSGNTRIWTKFKPGKETPIFVEASFMPVPKPEEDALTVALVFSVPMEAGKDKEAWPNKLAKSVEPYTSAAPIVAAAIGQILTAIQGINKKTKKDQAKTSMGESLKKMISLDSATKIFEKFGIPMDASFSSMLKGLGTKIGTAAVGLAAKQLMTKAFGVNGENQTIIEFSLEFACTGVKEIKKCFPGGGLKEAELTLKLTGAITKVRKVKVFNNTFYLEFGNTFAYEWVLKEGKELEAR